MITPFPRILKWNALYLKKKDFHNQVEKFHSDIFSLEKCTLFVFRALHKAICSAFTCCYHVTLAFLLMSALYIYLLVSSNLCTFIQFMYKAALGNIIFWKPWFATTLLSNKITTSVENNSWALWLSMYARWSLVEKEAIEYHIIAYMCKAFL